jgi:hypothetical protein
MKKTGVASDNDLGSFEGKYPKDLFNKTVVANGQTIGHIARETEDQIVVFGDFDDSRFDIPKSVIAVAGGTVIVNEGESVAQFTTDKDAPLPEGKSLRPSAEEIRTSARMQLETDRKKATTPDVIMSEARSLIRGPRAETISVSTPAGYVDTESELSKKMKRAAREFREIVVAGTRVAKKEARKAKEKADAKQAALDREAISRMGALSSTFSESFEEILTDIRKRSYADQVDIYTGFIKLLDQQRQLLVARRDFAGRLRDSVEMPVVESTAVENRRLKSPPELPLSDEMDQGTRREAGMRRRRHSVKKNRAETA